MCPAYVEESHSPGPTYGALDRTTEQLKKIDFYQGRYSSAD